MITIRCECGATMELPEADVNQVYGCCNCGKELNLVCPEQIPEGAGAGDFDARLVVTIGPTRLGQQILLGGCNEIEIGKQADRHISIPGPLVSRLHCKLVRVDFGPSRWRLDDNHSTNGLFVNGQRISTHELQHGDKVRVGNYELEYRVADDGGGGMAGLQAAATAEVAGTGTAVASPPTTRSVPGGGPVCPSCKRSLAPGAKVCTDCGIRIPSGRPLRIARDVDEASLYVKAENTIRPISWLLPTGLYPIASEAFGLHKPWTIRIIFMLTMVTSFAFFISSWTSDDDLPPGSQYMMWVGDEKKIDPALLAATDSLDEVALIDAQLDELKEEERDPDLTTEDRIEIAQDRAALMREKQALLRSGTPRQAKPFPYGFQWFQPITCAFLHGDLMHLAGNMVFLLVLGTRVNALIGNVATAVLYPILAVLSAVAYSLTSSSEPLHPMLGASGAIAGLAGMYLILFPVHRVFMTFWIRLGLIAGFRLWWKIWAVRGFWVVLFYFGFDVLWITLQADTGVAHWAHLGGLIAGMVIALGLIISRVLNARGGDILSVILGRFAWPLIGKPTTRKGLLA